MHRPDDVLAALAGTFDQVAELYDAVRPGYPEDLHDAIIGATNLPPGARLLEIGCGPGIATMPFARRGLHVIALEPGEALARLAVRNVEAWPGVQVVRQRFEDWPLEPQGFDLVYAAQSFHLIPRSVRVEKSARALRRGGSIAVFANQALAGDPATRALIQRAYEANAPSLAAHGPPVAWPAGGERLPYEDEIEDSGFFDSIRRFLFPWSRTYSAIQYGTLLQTFSDHRLLPPDRLEALVSAVMEAIRERGGTIEVPYVAWLVLSRRA